MTMHSGKQYQQEIAQKAVDSEVAAMVDVLQLLLENIEHREREAEVLMQQ